MGSCSLGVERTQNLRTKTSSLSDLTSCISLTRRKKWVKHNLEPSSPGQDKTDIPQRDLKLPSWCAVFLAYGLAFTVKCLLTCRDTTVFQLHTIVAKLFIIIENMKRT